MLIRCKKCGKPVHYAFFFGRVECGYCYADTRDPKDDPDPLVPAAVEWTEPLLRHMTLNPAETQDPAWNGFLMEEPAYQALLEKLRKKKEEKELRDLVSISRRMEYAVKSEEIDGLLRELDPLMHVPGTEVLLAALQKKKALLAGEERIREEKALLRKKLLHRLPLCAALAVCAVAALWMLLSFHLFQPRKLETAGALTAAGDFAAAESAYTALSLGRGGFPVNPSVREQAAAALPGLYSSWGDALAADERWEEAAAKHTLAGDEARAAEETKAYADALEKADRPEEAAAVWETLPGDEAAQRAASLYKEAARRRLDAGDFEGALAFLEKAACGGESPESEKEKVYLAWGCALAEQGDPAGAAAMWKHAGSAPDVNAVIREYQNALIRNAAAPALAGWKAEERRDIREKWIAMLQAQGEELTAADDVLYFWQLLDEAGIRLSDVFPNGAAVTDLSACGLDTEAPGEADPSRILGVLRQEKAYTLSQFDILLKPYQNDELDSGSYILRLLPGLWQALPPDRRPNCMADCTCILLADMTYVLHSQVRGRSLIPEYDPSLEHFTPSSSATVPPRKMSTYKGLLSLYTARARLLLWRWPSMEAGVLAQRDTPAPQAALPANEEVVVDWSRTRNNVDYRFLGLAGQFDTDWLQEAFMKAWQDLLDREAK